MRRGQCLSPLTAPVLRAIVTITFSGGIAFLGEHKTAGVKPLVSVQDFKNISPEPKYHCFLVGNLGIKRITKMVAGAPIFPNTMNIAAPKRDAPAAIQVPFL